MTRTTTTKRTFHNFFLLLGKKNPPGIYLGIDWEQQHQLPGRGSTPSRSGIASFDGCQQIQKYHLIFHIFQRRYWDSLRLRLRLWQWPWRESDVAWLHKSCEANMSKVQQGFECRSEEEEQARSKRWKYEAIVALPFPYKIEAWSRRAEAGREGVPRYRLGLWFIMRIRLM